MLNRSLLVDDASTGDREARERGAALIEFALVFPILVALLVGAVTAGLAYNQNNSLNNGARESARYAATLPVEGDLTSWLGVVADVAVASTSGDLDASVAGQNVCVAYVYPDGSDADDQTTKLAEVGGTRSVSTGTACYADGRPDGERRVQVVLKRTAEIEAVIFSSDVTLTAQSVTRYERAAG